MCHLSWNDVADEFVVEGSLRDIYVFDTDIEAWQRMLDGLRDSNYKLVFQRDSETYDLPASVADIFADKDEASFLLSVRRGGVAANCHFFVSEEIEFDIDPREIKGQAQLDEVAEFMHLLASATRLDAVLTPENSPGITIVRASPGEEKGTSFIFPTPAAKGTGTSPAEWSSAGAESSGAGEEPVPFARCLRRNRARRDESHTTSTGSRDGGFAVDPTIDVRVT